MPRSRTSTSGEVVRLPIPDHLEPAASSRALITAVRGYFYVLYNNRAAQGATFREYLKSIGNDDAVTKNRTFDRHEAVRMIKKQATDANDTATADAADGKVYECMVAVMRAHPELRLRLRRRDYERLTQQAAE